jgi:hypothetical protein
MGDHIPGLQMVVCLRHGDGKEAVGQLKAMYPEEAARKFGRTSRWTSEAR